MISFLFSNPYSLKIINNGTVNGSSNVHDWQSAAKNISVAGSLNVENGELAGINSFKIVLKIGNPVKNTILYFNFLNIQDSIYIYYIILTPFYLRIPKKIFLRVTNY